MAAYMNPFFSSGFSWGSAGLLTGFLASRPKSSVLAAGGTLATAAITYYVLILLVGQRWLVRPSDIETDATSSAGLLSVGRSIVFWTVVGLIGGGLMGWLGWSIRHSPVRLGSAVLGLSFALLVGEGVFTLINVQSIYHGPLNSFDLSKLVPALTQIVLGVVSAGYAIRTRRLPVAWPVVGTVGLASLAASVFIWYAVSMARMSL
ncbi:hypothetical protein ACN27F_29825 [Solwaraspora sp. WMMB335]|uniref:hypothetical protein n=1 Tax=Solwaraspora sp. WMMB335 TaxID=3404118 RepID=UPI003B948B7C